jgi:chemotaxis protein CheZ
MKKVIKNVQVIEHKLLQLLIDKVPIEKKENVNEGMLADPVVNPSGRIDVVTDQVQVDDLLKSLGF